MLLSKRYLTQSERHRRYVDGVGKEPKNSLLVHDAAFRFTECPQNLAQSRKLVNTCEEIEKQKCKSIARMNGEKHLLKLKYKGLLKNEERSHGIEETFFLQPGFRFRRNGDTRKIRDPRVIAEVDHRLPSRSLLSLARSNNSIQSIGSQSSKGQGQKSLASGDSKTSTGEGDGPVKKQSSVNVEQTIQEIERDLKRIKHDKDLININRRIQDVQSSLTFVRAHANDYKPAIPYVVQDHHKIFNSSGHNLPDSQPGSMENIKRLSRHYSKINCPACENRLKHENEKISSPEKSQSKHVQRWQSAPRGIYVSQMESKTTSHYNKRPTKSAKTQNTKESKERIAERARVSKSATSSGDMTQKKNWQRESRGVKMPKARLVGTVDKFKAAHLNPQQTQSENQVAGEKLLKTAQKQQSNPNLSLPDIVRASGEGKQQGMEKTHDLVSCPSQEDRSCHEETEKEDISTKVTAFCNKIPDVKPSIATWRNSSGQLVTWKPSDPLRAAKSSHECKMTWAEYQQNKRDVSLDHELQLKLYLSSQDKPTGDPNSYEELSKCRYLREFRMRRDLPEK